MRCALAAACAAHGVPEEGAAQHLPHRPALRRVPPVGAWPHMATAPRQWRPASEAVRGELGDAQLSHQIPRRDEIGMWGTQTGYMCACASWWALIGPFRLEKATADAGEQVACRHVQYGWERLSCCCAQEQHVCPTKMLTWRGSRSSIFQRKVGSVRT